MAQTSNKSHNSGLLRALVENRKLVSILHEGPRHKQELAHTLDISPKTIYRKTCKLHELGLVDKNKGGYELTSIGKLHAALFDDVESISNCIDSNPKLVSDISQYNLPPYWLFFQSDLINASIHAPDQPIKEMERLVSDATKLKGFSPVILSKYVDIFYEQAISNDLTAELVFNSAVMGHLRSNYRSKVGAAINSGIKMWETTSELPFGLILVESPVPSVMVFLYGSENRLNGIIQNDSSTAISWASKMFHNYKTSSIQREIIN